MALVANSTDASECPIDIVTSGNLLNSFIDSLTPSTSGAKVMIFTPLFGFSILVKSPS